VRSQAVEAQSASADASAGSAPADVYYIDHSIFVTANLDAAAARYEAMGFTLSPLSRHSGSSSPGGPVKPLASANRCAYFGRNYLELLGLDPAQEAQWKGRPNVRRYEALHGVVLGCGDAESVLRRLNGAGIASGGVLSLGREVETPAGARNARFLVIAPETKLETMPRIGQHLTPEYIHQPRYLSHANGASALVAVLLVVADDAVEDYTAIYAATMGVEPEAEGPRRVLRLQLGAIEIVPASAFADLLPGESVPMLPFWAAHAVAVADLGAARSVLEANGIPTEPLAAGFFVRAADAYGETSVIFVEAGTSSRMF
jgi:hypothetical protein